MNKNTCPTCNATLVMAVKDSRRASGYQIIECIDCDGTGYKPGTPEYSKARKESPVSLA